MLDRIARDENLLAWHPSRKTPHRQRQNSRIAEGVTASYRGYRMAIGKSAQKRRERRPPSRPHGFSAEQFFADFPPPSTEPLRRAAETDREVASLL
jgi:hypothetical protein